MMNPGSFKNRHMPTRPVCQRLAEKGLSERESDVHVSTIK